MSGRMLCSATSISSALQHGSGIQPYARLGTQRIHSVCRASYACARISHLTATGIAFPSFDEGLTAIASRRAFDLQRRLHLVHFLGIWSIEELPVCGTVISLCTSLTEPPRYNGVRTSATKSVASAQLAQHVETTRQSAPHQPSPKLVECIGVLNMVAA